MKRFGFAIRTGGDPEIAGALAAGIEKGTEETPHPNAFGGRLHLKGKAMVTATGTSEAVRRVAMMRHTPEEWAAMTEDARVCYGGRAYTPRWAEGLLIGWAMVCLGVSWLYHRQDRLLRRAQ